MIQANVRDVKAKLSAYLARVQQGEEVMILSRGKPVAILKPVEQPAPLPSMKSFREKIRMKGLPSSEEIIKMRKDFRY